MLDKETVNKHWYKECERYRIPKDKVYWRYGYPKGLAHSYIQYFDFSGSIRVTLDDEIKTEAGMVREIRHEFFHLFVDFNKIKIRELTEEINSYLAEYFPNFVLNKFRRK